MKPFVLTIVLAGLCRASSAQETYRLEDMQGAWWSDKTSPTADFAIMGREVWLDYDSAYHPCEIADGNILVFNLGADGTVKHKIISMEANTLVLENLETHEFQNYAKAE